MPTGNLSRTCRWVLSDGTYCELAVEYKMVKDGGEPGARLIRKYSTFCPEHEERKDNNNDA